MPSDSVCTDSQSQNESRDVCGYDIPNVGVSTYSESPERFEEDVPSSSLAIRIVYGRTRMLDTELSRLGEEDVIELDEPIESDVHILANGRLIALGELVTVEGCVGVKIKRLLMDEEAGREISN